MGPNTVHPCRGPASLNPFRQNAATPALLRRRVEDDDSPTATALTRLSPYGKLTKRNEGLPSITTCIERDCCKTQQYALGSASPRSMPGSRFIVMLHIVRKANIIDNVFMYRGCRTVGAIRRSIANVHLLAKERLVGLLADWISVGPVVWVHDARNGVSARRGISNADPHAGCVDGQ